MIGLSGFYVEEAGIIHPTEAGLTVSPARAAGTVVVPSSKSHTIRALLIAACADGISHIANCLDSADARSCIAALEVLGCSVEETGRSATGVSLAVTPPPGGILSSRPEAEPLSLDVGNSGTTLYLLAALAAQREQPVTFDGDRSIRSRDAGPLLKALTEMGATLTGGPRAPFTLQGPLRPGTCISFPSPTSQFLSALLLTAPLIPASGPDPEPTVLEPQVLHERPYVDMTCWWLEAQHISLERQEYQRFIIPPGQHYQPVRTSLPGDYSSATFWFAAAAVTGGTITVEGLEPEDVQGDRKVLDIFSALGCTVQWHRSDASTPAVSVTGPITRGGTFDLNAMPDALPALAAAACYAPEPVSLTNVPQAREKETDRIDVMTRELTALGALIEEHPDGMTVKPRKATCSGQPPLEGGTLHSHGDHRVAMAGAVAALGAAAPVRIIDAEAAAVTYPAFFAELARLAPGSLLPGRTEPPAEGLA
ncbi:3-phosphoshikimate 1-carboxyvinyltransferase [Alkalispirochaeta americana]|uniref:3-phosphoshikimate 1-carboxyvinyltransferase n=1 Tax=Alkalispirochaeta americana TaxID=159291 RepID=A0A1N6TNK7_9SPIO|nr:3-phosphoshikimate 1-carboxyvinyltransferase [Alkalispirochaeta americana]SIQ54925.1 3-phosphoshikimate 1-carboxyvinyltransferase [Alkalispirochaeta americana]